MTSSYGQQRRAAAVEIGLCSTCWTQPAQEGLKTCVDCRQFGKSRYQERTQRGLCLSCDKRVGSLSPRFCDYHHLRRERARWRAKAECIDAYGGKCQCCGETELDFLTIDHKKGEGNKHREELFGSKSVGGLVFYRWLRNQGYPKKMFQVLCFNCNFSKHRRGGRCIHQDRAEPSAGVFRNICADPPWKYGDYGHQGHGAARHHYPCMTMTELRSLRVDRLAHPEACALWLWVTGPKLREGIDLVRAWGFSFKTVAFVWKKLGRMGLGSYTRSETEFVLLGIRGSGMTLLRKSASIRQVVETRVGRHSEKPQEIYDKIQALLPGPYLELFARAPRPGWKVWGNEVASDIDMGEKK